MTINQDLLERIEASAHEWGPDGQYGNDEKATRGGKEGPEIEVRLGLCPISIRFPKELVRDLKAIAQLNGMSYQPLIREVCKRFVEAEKRAIHADRAQRRQKEADEQRKLEEEVASALKAEAQAEERKAA